MSSLLSVLMILVYSAVSASGSLLENMQKRVASMGTVEMSVSVDGMEVKIVSSGDSYLMESQSLRIWCDGKSQWVYSEDSGEMSVVTYDSQGNDPVENPTAALNSSILKSYYVVSEKNGCIILHSRRDVRVSYPEIEVRVDSSSLPVSLKVTNTSRKSVEIRINRIGSISDTGISFRPSGELMENSAVTDLR